MQNWEAGRQCCSAAHFCEIVFAKQDYIPPCQRRNAEFRREALQHNVWQLIKLDEKERNQETEHIGVLWRNRYLCWVRAEIRRFLKGKLDAERTDELSTLLRKAGLPI